MCYLVQCHGINFQHTLTIFHIVLKAKHPFVCIDGISAITKHKSTSYLHVPHISYMLGKNPYHQVCVRGPKSQWGRLYFGSSYSERSVGGGLRFTDRSHLLGCGRFRDFGKEIFCLKNNAIHICPAVSIKSELGCVLKSRWEIDSRLRSMFQICLLLINTVCENVSMRISTWNHEVSVARAAANYPRKDKRPQTIMMNIAIIKIFSKYILL